MRFEWVANEGRSRVLVFFAGWAMDARPFQRLGSAHHDVCICFDYRGYASVLDEILSTDSATARLLGHSRGEWESIVEVVVVAWSFGCAVAAQVMACPWWPVADAVAINGTVTPEDARCGIPPELISATADNLLSGGWDKFVRRMCLERAAREDFQRSPPARNLAEAANELAVLRRIKGGPPCPFTLALVGTKDRIISPENQQRGWQRLGVAVQTIAASHYPFHLWSSWDELLETARGGRPKS